MTQNYASNTSPSFLSNRFHSFLRLEWPTPLTLCTLPCACAILTFSLCSPWLDADNSLFLLVPRHTGSLALSPSLGVFSNDPRMVLFKPGHFYEPYHVLPCSPALLVRHVSCESFCTHTTPAPRSEHRFCTGLHWYFLPFVGTISLHNKSLCCTITLSRLRA